MSGIFGYLLKNKTDIDCITPMSKWNNDYGRDARDSVCMEKIGMGAAINHLSVVAPIDTPVISINDMYAVVDALIYNRDELADKLPDIDINKLSDERLIVELYLKYGPEGLRDINGDFAGAIFDGSMLTLLRSHLGVRPLYWYKDDNMVAFATDMRSILAMPGIDKSIDEEYLYANLNGYYVDESEITDFARIKAVHTGGIVTVDANLNANKSLYWRLGEKKIRYKTDKEYMDRMRELVYDSIRRRLDVVKGKKVGAELSGGLDSSVIDVIIKKLGVDPICYSWSPSLEEFPMQHHDQREIIEKTCETFGLKCMYGCGDYLSEEDDIWNCKRENNYPPGVYNSFVNSTMYKVSSMNIPIVFSGWGGDEGVSHRCNQYELWYHGERMAYLKNMWSTSHGLKKPLRFIKKVYLNLTRDRKYFHEKWDYYKANRSKRPEFLNDRFVSKIKNKTETLPVYFAYDPISDINVGGNRGRIETNSILGAKYNVQCVFPFLDYRVEDYAVSIPRRLYVKGNKYRYIYRETFKEDMIPELYNYVYKDDPGRCKYLSDRIWNNDVALGKLKLIIDGLDKGYWSEYLYFDGIADIFNKSSEYDVDTIVDMLNRCIEIQNS